MIPRATLNYLSVAVAETKGFFRDQKLDNQTIVIPGSTAIAALVSGNVDFSGAGGTGMRAALRGAPIKASCFRPRKSPGICSRRRRFKKLPISSGKRVAVGTIGDTQDALITLLVEREGMSGPRYHPDRHAVAQHHDTRSYR